MSVAYRLYSDNEVFHQEHPADASLASIMAHNGIPGRARLKVEVADRREYRVDKSGFTFSITDVLK